MDINDGKDKAENASTETNSTPTNGGSSPAPNGGGSSGLQPASLPVGGVTANFTGLPTGFLSDTLGLEADVSGEFADLAPTFGDVLLSIGTGVASSQDALDRGLVDTAKQLSDTKITVISDVVQELNDDGLPDPSKTELIANEVSLIQFVNPTVHEWKHVALSMDLTVGAMDQERGMSFNAKQYSGGVHGYGLFWGFLGWFDMNMSDSQQSGDSRSRQESDWASGQVRLDAMLAPRRTSKFPVPAQVTIGPQIFFSQGSVNKIMDGDVVTQRSMDILIKVRKASGAPNPNVNLEVDVSNFLFSFSTSDGFTGSTTNAQGEAKITVTRDIPPGFSRTARIKVTASLGKVSKELEITL